MRVPQSLRKVSIWMPSSFLQVKNAFSSCHFVIIQSTERRIDLVSPLQPHHPFDVSSLLLSASCQGMQPSLPRWQMTRGRVRCSLSGTQYFMGVVSQLPMLPETKENHIRIKCQAAWKEISGPHAFMLLFISQPSLSLFLL